MSKKIAAIVAAAIEESHATIGSVPASKLLQRANAERIMSICTDLVTSWPARDPVSPVVAELGQIRYGKFPAPQTLLNHYPKLLRVWRQAFQQIVNAAAPVPTKPGQALAIADEDLQVPDSGTKARVQLALAAMREAKLENDRLKKIIRDAIPAPGHEQPTQAASTFANGHVKTINAWLFSVDSGLGGLEIDALGLPISRRGRIGTVVMTTDVLNALRAVCSMGDVNLNLPPGASTPPKLESLSLKLPFIRSVPDASG